MIFCMLFIGLSSAPSNATPVILDMQSYPTDEGFIEFVAPNSAPPTISGGILTIDTGSGNFPPVRSALMIRVSV
jgi:hypothetical protein